MNEDDELRYCNECGASCDMRIGHCECDPTLCPYPVVDR